MASVTITVDLRERRSGMPTLLSDLGVEVELSTLAVGDYAVGTRVVERKAVADLHRSLLEGRMWSQVASLRRDDRRAYLVVEGRDLDDGEVPRRAIRGALLKVLDNGIRVIQTTSREDSALWLRLLAGQEHRRLARSTRSPQRGTRPIVTSPVGLIAAIPGIGIDRARSLIDRFGSVAGIAAANDEDLRSVEGIGPTRARVLREALTYASIASSR